MKLTTPKSKVAFPQLLPVFSGLVKGGIEYSVEKAVSDLEYIGPKISVRVWESILAFFADTYKRTRSECQVRLYVNADKKEWAAWAYPQEARSGMSAKEIDNAQATQQRKQFSESEGWVYFGTVHHHCASHAFQSSTDEHNEQSQDGLHITIGNMDEKQHTIHARFYAAGTRYEPDLSLFWDIGEPWVRVPKPLLDHHGLACLQMCMPVTAEATYPEQWRENLVEAVSTVIHVPRAAYGEFQNPILPSYDKNKQRDRVEHDDTPDYFKGSKNGKGKKQDPEVKRREYALRQVRNQCRLTTVSDVELERAFIMLQKNPILQIIRQAARDHSLTLFDIATEFEWEQDLHAQALQQQLTEGGNGYGYGV